MADEFIPVGGKMHAVIGDTVADAIEVALSDGTKVETAIQRLLQTVESLQKQIDELKEGGVIPPETKITDALMLANGKYIKLRNGKYLKLNTKKQ